MTDTAVVARGRKIAEGKTKALYELSGPGTSYGIPREELALMVHKDDITAGDGGRRDVIEGKGTLSCRTTTGVFRYLERNVISTHYVDTLDDTTMVVRRVEMIPIEWVARRIATGSYIKRTGAVEGTRFDPLVLELFLKDDARHDPQITPEEAVSMGLCSEPEMQTALTETGAVFALLEEAWADQDVQLVDLKVEFGRARDGLLLADVVDNDSWRLWPKGRRELMLDKQAYRDLQDRNADALEDVRGRYVEVARRIEALSVFESSS
jgi:phosphoribosylaminoimidazole-succinocarboxamide synthase